ncbi:MAG: RIP metalloprotease RseP [Gammaproteobacteria bacterium]|nr:RIP metalloprotease RseP [Gammaproteobacteria bacterium]
MSAIYTILSFVVAIGILVVVHEFGHFWVAKKLGVKVLRFSVGFGKPLWSRRFGADSTELVLAAIPLGGYVKMLGEDDDDVPEQERHRAFNRKPLASRVAIVIAGPLFNFIFAILAYAFVFNHGVDDLVPEVGRVEPGSIAYSAGVRAGDVLMDLDGRPVNGWGEHRIYLMKRALSGEVIHLRVRKTDGAEHATTIDLSAVDVGVLRGRVFEDALGLFPFQQLVEPVVGNVLEGAGKAAGLRQGDRVVSVNNQEMKTWMDLVAVVGSNPGNELSMIIDRNGVKQKLRVIPETVATAERVTGRINVSVQLPEFPKNKLVRLEQSVGQSLLSASEHTWNMSVLTLQMLYKMLSLEVSTENISGPITIAQYAGKSAEVGLDRFVLFLAIVSISLGVLNLLPIPVLDGGHLLYYLIEAIKGSPLSEESMVIGQQLGMFLLAGLMILAFYNDLTRLFG